MKIINDEAIILNKKESSNANLVINLFCKDIGKICALAYNIRNSKKKDLNSLIPGKISEVELEETNGSYILKNSIIKHSLNNNLKSIYRLQLSLYILHCLNELLQYGYKDIQLYEFNVEILKFIDTVDENKLKDEIYMYNFILKYLKKMMIEFGIYDINEILITENLKKMYFKNKDEIQLFEIKKIIDRFEKYINEYYLVNINYRKIFI